MSRGGGRRWNPAGCGSALPGMTTDSSDDPFHLSRFLQAQKDSYDVALAELRVGRKRTHWMWYIFPQLRGLGRSGMAQKFGVSGLDEARAYLAHPVLGARLNESAAAVLAWAPRLTANALLGEVDAVKLRSSLTLFEAAAAAPTVFSQAIEGLFRGSRDGATLQLLSERPTGGPNQDVRSERDSRVRLALTRRP